MRSGPMSQLLANNYRYRSSYTKTPSVLDVQNLIEIQKTSYDIFLQPETSPDDREDHGLQAVFKGVFPIQDLSPRSTTSKSVANAE
jgi:DNA-directed RNA polymerase subunit beta